MQKKKTKVYSLSSKTLLTKITLRIFHFNSVFSKKISGFSYNYILYIYNMSTESKYEQNYIHDFHKLQCWFPQELNPMMYCSSRAWIFSRKINCQNIRTWKKKNSQTFFFFSKLDLVRLRIVICLTNIILLYICILFLSFVILLSVTDILRSTNYTTLFNSI